MRLAMILGLNHAQITFPPDQEQAAREFYCGVLKLLEAQKLESLQSRELLGDILHPTQEALMQLLRVNQRKHSRKGS